MTQLSDIYDACDEFLKAYRTDDEDGEKVETAIDVIKLALAGPQPEPVSEDHVRMFIQDCAEDADLNTDGDDAEALAVAFTNRYTITARPASRLVSSPDGDSR